MVIPNAKPFITHNGIAVNARHLRALRIDYFKINETQYGPLEEEHQVVVSLWNEAGDLFRVDGSPKDIQAWIHALQVQLDTEVPRQLLS